jgi:proteasome assembly chaperone (PAC2) family protein
MELERCPELVNAVMVAAFEGWNDAGDAATGVVEHLELAWDATPVASIDSDDYYDFQVNRPIMSLVDGVTRRVSWPTTRISWCRPPGAAFDLVLLRGVEPNMRWRSFCDEILEVVRILDIRTVVTLGALLSDSPHTRPTQVTGTAYDAAAAAQYGLDQSRYEGPTGIVGILQDACVNVGIPAISFWAGVPHYVSQPPNPKATVALLHSVEEVLDLAVPLGELPDQAIEWQKLVDEMAAEDEEVTEYIRNLEERDGDGEMHEISGDVIAGEFERYLRRRDRGGGFGSGHSSSGGG